MIRRRALFLLTLLAALPGCLGTPWHVGTASLYAPDIQTVYVPMFESRSFRRGLGERLTEAVVKEIEVRTPYKVVNTCDADSVLTGKLTSDTKRVILESPTDEGRELDIHLQVQVTWVNRKGDMICAPQTVPVPPVLVDVGQSANLVPEYGESLVTTEQEAITRMARQIVSLMEAPW